MELPPDDAATAGASGAPSTPDHAADGLAELVRREAGHIIVMLGPRSSGKTQFLRQRVLPLLTDLGPVRFFDCATEVSAEAIEAVTQAGALVVLDSFDRFLRLPEKSREPALRALFTADRRATIILVTSNSCLAELFDLRRLVPDILNHRFEMSGLRLASQLPQYSPSPDLAPLSWDVRVLDALEDDLARMADGTVTWPLVELIDAGFRAAAFDPQRGLVGLLETHLERALARVSELADHDERTLDVVRAVLKEIAGSDGHGTGWLSGVAERMDVPARVPEQCYRWLVDTSGLLKPSVGEGLEPRPPQLSIVIDQWLAEDRNACAKAKRFLADGIEGRYKVGTLLPRERFNDVHAQRSLLRTMPEESAFLTLCALRFYPDGDTSSVDHWLNRLGDATLKVSTLCEALVDPLPRARRLAAALLADMDEPRVHGHLCHAALEDAALEVRRQAIDSLAGFVHKEPIRSVLTQAATEGTDERRIRAIEALRIFQDEECARFLESIVSNPNESAVREAAIRALALTRSETGTSALVRIALHDADADDRSRACETLSTLASPILVEFGWHAAINDWESARPAHPGRWWKKLGHWPAVLVVVLLSLSLHGLPLVFFRRWRTALTFVAVEVSCIAGVNMMAPSSDWWAVAWLLNWFVSIAVSAWVARGVAAPSGTFQRVLSNALLASTMVTSGLVLHGLGHWITRRRRQAMQVFGAELIAMIVIWPTFTFESAFNQGTGSNFDRLTQLLLYFYRFGGLALSWVWAVSWLYLNERWGRRGPWLSEPHSEVLRALLKAPESAVALGRSLADPARASAARMLLNRFGDGVPGTALLSVLEHDALGGHRCPTPIVRCLSRHKDQKGYETVVVEAGGLFDRLQPAQRDQLVDVLVRNPTESSVQCLAERRDQLRIRDRVRLVVAAIRRPFLGWHWAVRLATAATALLGLLLAVDGFRTTVNPAWPLIKELRSLSRMDGPDRSAEVATIADFLAKHYTGNPADDRERQHAREVADSLVAAFREVELRMPPATAAEWELQRWERYAKGLASSLGVVMATPAPEETPGCEVKSGSRALAVEALVAPVAKRQGSVGSRSAILEALNDAANRGGSIELVCGLVTLFIQAGATDTKTVAAEQLHEAQQLQGRIAAMLASVAKPPDTAPVSPSDIRMAAAKGAIAQQAETLASLLQTSADAGTKRTLLHALQVSGEDASVAAIKAFILFDGTPLGRQPNTVNPDDQLRAREAADLAKEHLELRALAVDSLLAIQTPAAEAAIMDLPGIASLPREIVSKTAVALEARARLLQQENKIDEALKRARAAVAADQRNADARATLGSLLYGQGKLDDSLRELRTATQIEPAYSWAYYMQALILKEQRQYQDAEAVLSKALQTDPRYPWSYALLREIYVAQERDADAVAALRGLKAKHPDVGEIYTQLAYIYHERIALTDPSAYELAYETNQQLLALIGTRDPEQALPAEMGLVECRLTTGRYAELVSKVRELQPQLEANTDYLMTAHLLTLAAQALTNDSQGALKTLSELRVTYANLRANPQPGQQRNNWVYFGTLAYLARQPRTPQTAAVVDLLNVVNNIAQEILSGDRRPSEIPIQVFENARVALEAVTSNRPRARR